MDLTYFLPVLYAFVACLGFGGLYNLHGKPVFWAAVGLSLIHIYTGWFTSFLDRRASLIRSPRVSFTKSSTAL